MRVGRFKSIQYLRGIAALMVVFHHARLPRVWAYNPLAGLELGQSGVDIFFVISGFIMASVGRHEEPVEFVKRRLIRILPLYWIATMVMVAIRPGPIVKAGFFGHLVKSLLMIPHSWGVGPTAVLPVLIPGWTLNIEILFYAIFALALVWRPTVRIATIGLISGVVAAPLFHFHVYWWQVYTSPLLVEFTAGMWLALLIERYRLPLPGLALAAGVAWLLGTAVMGSHPSLIGLDRLLLWGPAALLIVAGAVGLEKAGKLPALPTFERIGDASYSIYLWEAVVLLLVDKIMFRFAPHGLFGFVAFMLVSIGAVLLVGLISYDALERRIIGALRRLKTALTASAMA